MKERCSNKNNEIRRKKAETNRQMKYGHKLKISHEVKNNYVVHVAQWNNDRTCRNFFYLGGGGGASTAISNIIYCRINVPDNTNIFEIFSYTQE